MHEELTKVAAVGEIGITQDNRGHTTKSIPHFLHAKFVAVLQLVCKLIGSVILPNFLFRSFH